MPVSESVNKLVCNLKKVWNEYCVPLGAVGLTVFGLRVFIADLLVPCIKVALDSVGVVLG